LVSIFDGIGRLMNVWPCHTLRNDFDIKKKKKKKTTKMKEENLIQIPSRVSNLTCAILEIFFSQEFLFIFAWPTNVMMIPLNIAIKQARSKINMCDKKVIHVVLIGHIHLWSGGKETMLVHRKLLGKIIDGSKVKKIVSFLSNLCHNFLGAFSLFSFKNQNQHSCHEK
jgi:hypothetical protein